MWQELSPALYHVSAALACVIVAAVLFARSRENSGKRLPPGNMEWPVGGLQHLKAGFRKLFVYDDEGPRKMRFLGTPTALFWHPDQVKTLINSDQETLDSAWSATTLSLLGYQSITAISGAQHRLMRRLLGPCLSPQAVEGYMPAIQEICERYCASWVQATAAAEVAAGPAGSIDLEQLPQLQKQARLLTFEVISHAVAGLRFSPAQLSHLSDNFDTLVRGLFVPVAIALPGSAYAKAWAARKVILAALDRQFDAIQSKATSGPTTPGGDAAAAAAAPPPRDTSAGSDLCPGRGASIIEQLMSYRNATGQPFDRAVLQDNAINLLFAGHETTAGSIVRLFVVLRSRPDVVARLRQEQRAVVDTHGDKVTGAVLRDMPYLDAVVKENMRMGPPVVFVPRKLKRDIKVNGYDIPKNWRLLLGISQTIKHAPGMRNVPEGDPLDPRVFNPDRWQISAPGEEPPLRPGALASPLGMLPSQLMTFGGGLRYCPGANLAWAEIKVFLSVFFRRFDFVAPLEHMDVKEFPSVTVTGGFPVKVRYLPGDSVAAA